MRRWSGARHVGVGTGEHSAITPPGPGHQIAGGGFCSGAALADHASSALSSAATSPMSSNLIRLILHLMRKP